MATDPRYDVVLSTTEPLDGTLIVGLSNVGLAGVTAVDHLVHQLDFEQVGHVRTRNLPTVTPFEDGEPRHPIRVYGAPESDLCALLSEVVVPVWAADEFTGLIADLIAESAIEEVAVFHGVPFPHGPEEHALFSVATPAYRERRLEATDVAPLGGGVLDGVPGELMARSMDGDLPPLGALVTPIHPPGPDFEAALRYLSFVRDVHGLEIDDEQLRERSEAMTQYYAELADRMEALEAEGAERGSRSLPEDRMYM